MEDTSCHGTAWIVLLKDGIRRAQQARIDLEKKLASSGRNECMEEVSELMNSSSELCLLTQALQGETLRMMEANHMAHTHMLNQSLKIASLQAQLNELTGSFGETEEAQAQVQAQEEAQAQVQAQEEAQVQVRASRPEHPETEYEVPSGVIFDV